MYLLSEATLSNEHNLIYSIGFFFIVWYIGLTFTFVYGMYSKGNKAGSDEIYGYVCFSSLVSREYKGCCGTHWYSFAFMYVTIWKLNLELLWVKSFSA